MDDGFCDEESFEHSEDLDPTGKLSSLTYPTCVSADNGCGAPHPRTLDYTYDSGSGFLTAIPGWADNISYHSNMALNEIHHANGIVDVIGRDPNFMSRPSSLHVESAGGQTLWESGTFRYDGAGNLLEMAATDFTDRFVYDGVSRLVQSRQWVRRSPDAGAEIFTDGFESGDTSEWVEFQESYLADVYTDQTFTFDIPGNLLSVDTDGDVRSHSVSSTTNRLGGSAQYDGAGNLTQFTDESGQTVTFEYDAFNRLIYREQGGHFTHFLYTADDERILRFGTGGFSWSLRDFQGRVLREFRPESNRLQPIRDHIYRGASPIATVTVDENDILSKRHHLSLDHLGSPRYVTDGAGNFIAEHKYYPFGEEATRPAQNDLPLKFTGHERDFYADGASDDLDYMHARFCDPRVGRFLSVDPVLGSPDIPQSWNRYAYVRGNPLMYVDPTGKYGRGAGFTDEQWKLIEKSQERVAARMEKKSEKLRRKAEKWEKRGKIKKAANAREAAGYLAAGAETLRSDGSDGRIANAVDAKTYESLGGSRAGAAFVKGNGPEVTINIEHENWSSSGMQAQRSLGHESLHTVGLSDQRGSNGFIAYQFGFPGNRAAFEELKGTPLALVNPDHLMDLVF